MRSLHPLLSSPLFGDKEDPISFTKHGDEKNSLRGLGGKGTIKKVQICHIPPDDPSDFHTITINESAKTSHLTHGDLEGPCNDNCNTLCNSGGPEENCEENGCIGSGGGGRSTDTPSEIPSASPSASMIPSDDPTDSPSEIPSASPSASMIPSEVPTDSPSEIPSASPSMIPSKVPTSRKTRIVRVQLMYCNFLHLREVEVFDQDDVNVALNKVATQSSLFYNLPKFDASYAVDGDKSISDAHSMSHTNHECGKYRS